MVKLFSLPKAALSRVLLLTIQLLLFFLQQSTFALPQIIISIAYISRKSCGHTSKMSYVDLFSHLLGITFQRESSMEARQLSGFCRGPSENLLSLESGSGTRRSKRTESD
jgi:hypothetical protein